LEQVLNLAEVGVRVAVVDEGVKELGRFPDRLLADVEAEIFLLFAEDEVQGLVRVVEAVELGDAGVGLGVVVAELREILAFLVAAGNVIISIIELGERVFGGGNGAHDGFPPL